MARLVRGRRIIDDSSDDEFPDIRQIGSFQTMDSRDARLPPILQIDEPTSRGIVRRRKLGSVFDDAVVRPSMARGTSGTIFDDDDTSGNKLTRSRRLEFQARKTEPAGKKIEIELSSDAESVQEETIIEDFSFDNEFDSEDSQSSESEDEDPTAGLFVERSPPRPLKRPGGGFDEREYPSAKRQSPTPSLQLLAEAREARERSGTRDPGSIGGIKSKSRPAFGNPNGLRSTAPTDLSGPYTKLKAYEPQPPRSKDVSSYTKRPTTPTSPPLGSRYKGLASPSKKIDRIPTTPHHPQADTFWDQEFIDEWNDEHSPKKQLFPRPASPQSPSKKRSPSKKAPSQAAVAKAAKKAFEQSKDELAAAFLKELDERITGGKISELTTETGGIRIEWTNRLKTTAGRANWRREKTTTTMRRKDGGGDAAAAAATPVTSFTTCVTTSVTYRHHAFIELAEKVIDDEHRLLNVVAHEFCHLANYMVSGVRDRPHGSEFKVWAGRVTRAFGGSRGVEVTTKHSYEIDFKYVWTCESCAVEYKRHSRSINTERHRCGRCKGALRQTRPVPRGKPAKESEYQRFMKEQMKIIRLENPGSPQKDIMRLVASRWSQKEKEKENGDEGSGDKTLGGASSSSSRALGGGKEKDGGVARSIKRLSLIDLTDLG